MKSAFLSLLIAVLLSSVFAAPARAQDDEVERRAQALIVEWNAFESRLRAIERTLADMQARYNGAVGQEREGIRARYKVTRDTALKSSRELVAKINAFIEKHPDNVALRKKRLDDNVFSNLSPALKAQDAEALLRLTGEGEYLHRAAELYGKAYNYERAAELWGEAVDRAATFAALTSWAEALIQVNEFKRAKAAYERASEAATGDQQKREAQSGIQTLVPYIARWDQEKEYRAEAAKKNDLPMAKIVTDRGTMTVELFEDQAPNTVANFIKLAEDGFYDGLKFHRNLAYFMIQGGDPANDGSGGPGYRIKDEFQNPGSRIHYAGSLSMANTGRPDTNGSQFFVTNAVTPWLNNKHTVFGRVVDGIEVAQVRPIDPTNKANPFTIEKIEITRKRDHEYTVEKIAN